MVFGGTIRKSIGLCRLLCSVPEGATLSDGKVSCPVYKWLGVEGVIYKLTAPEAVSCSEWINIDPELPLIAAEASVASR